MSNTELAIWSAMLGGLLTLAVLALSDAIGNRSAGAMRNLFFVLIPGASCVVMTGMPEQLFPALSERTLMVLRASLGPAAGGIALQYLGRWLGGVRGDALVQRLTAWGGTAVAAAAVLLALVASQVEHDQFKPVLLSAAVINMLPVLLAMAALLRGARLGDPLAPWMLLAVVCLAAVVGGLYGHALLPGGLDLLAQLLIAMLTVAHFLMGSVLVLLRNRHDRRLARLSRIQIGADPATGLLTGSALLAEVEHVFWRTARQNSECTVVCLYVENLYELAETAGRCAELQIQTTLAARIRRAAGFRCVVGLYHPRCFVVVLSSDRFAAPASDMVDYLRVRLAEPITVQDEQQASQVFRPLVGVGAISNAPAEMKPVEVIHEAEREAMERSAPRWQHNMRALQREHDIDTAPQQLA